jgi:GntR family transcriptional regulator/MocR family aminotransferase
MQIPLSVDFQKQSAIQQQVVAHLRRMIQEGALPPGSRVPSTRSLSEQLRVSRGSVVIAYHHLAAEGYLETQSATATFVSRDLPESFMQASHVNELMPALACNNHEPGAFLERVQPLQLFDPEQDKLSCDFRMGRAEKSFFPIKAWRRLIPECLGGAEHALSQYGDPAGYRPLRVAISSHVLRARGVRCAPEQVIIVAGCQEGLNVISRVLLSPGAAVAVEDPCYQGAAGVFEAHHAQLIPIPLDDGGLNINALAASHAKLAYVTPSHQFPLGSTMPLERRKGLINWAIEAGAYVIEDDYDSDFRYERSPLSAVKSFDTAERVIYIGTFSKSIGAGLRLGYVIVPPQLVQAATAAKALINNGHPWLDQAVMAEFIRSGAFEKHLRLIRKHYLGRRDHLIAQLRLKLSPDCIVKGADSGMHLAVYLPGMPMTAHQLQIKLKAMGVGVYSLQESPARQFSRFAHDEEVLLLGYAGLTEQKISIAISRMAEVLQGSEISAYN